MMERLTHYQKNGEVAEPYNRSQANEFAKKLAQYEDLEEQGLLVRLPEGMTLDVIAKIMHLCENFNSNRVKRGEEPEPTITWQLYNALLKLTKGSV